VESEKVYHHYRLGIPTKSDKCNNIQKQAIAFQLNEYDIPNNMELNSYGEWKSVAKTRIEDSRVGRCYC
jgi:hypothetical protein